MLLHRLGRKMLSFTVTLYINEMCGYYMTVSSPRYFNALAKGECLPVKERLEMNVATQKTDTGLTPGLLKILHKQVGNACSNRFLYFYILFYIYFCRGINTVRLRSYTGSKWNSIRGIHSH